MAAFDHRRTGSLIRQMREDRGWTHEDMAAEILQHPKLGVRYQASPHTIWRVEGGHRPSVRKAFGIATVLETSPSQLWPSRPVTRKLAA